MANLLEGVEDAAVGSVESNVVDGDGLGFSERGGGHWRRASFPESELRPLPAPASSQPVRLECLRLHSVSPDCDISAIYQRFGPAGKEF